MDILGHSGIYGIFIAGRSIVLLTAHSLRGVSRVEHLNFEMKVEWKELWGRWSESGTEQREGRKGGIRQLPGGRKLVPLWKGRHWDRSGMRSLLSSKGSKVRRAPHLLCPFRVYLATAAFSVTSCAFPANATAWNVAGCFGSTYRFSAP
jgi:hypothetical protein